MIRAAILAALLALAVFSPVAAQTLPATPATCPPPDDPPAEPGLQAALDQINALRRQAGVAPLRLNVLLTRAAQLHADDMVHRRFFSHRSPDGRGPAERVSATGYQYRAVGENIAMGYADWSAAIRGWMGSTGHRANILRASFTEIGLGTASRRWVQVFASPR